MDYSSIGKNIAKSHKNQPNFDINFVSQLTDAKNAFEDKVKDKIIQIDNPEQSFTKKLEKKLLKKQRKKKPWNRRQRKASKMYDIPSTATYSMFEPLHLLWSQYIANALSDSSEFAASFLKADFHGMILSVIQSSCPTNVGIEGIVVKDTENMFYIITKQDQVKAIPKINHVFKSVVNGKHILLYGNQLKCRPVDRINKKFKQKPTIEF